MCILYNDIEYHHGIRVAKQTDAGFRYFDIMTTKHTENQPYRYSGICLNNGYEVCTNEYAKHFALIELLEKIVADTLASEREYPERYPGESFKPIVNIQEKNPDVYKNFSVKMKDARLLDEYNDIHENIKPFLEKPRFDPKSGKNKPVGFKRLKDMIATVPIRIKAAWQTEIVYDCKEMYLASHFVKSNETLKDCEIKYARV